MTALDAEAVAPSDVEPRQTMPARLARRHDRWGVIGPRGLCTGSARRRRKRSWGGHDHRHARHASALDAALANGTASHSMELDDVAIGMGGHPSVSVCSAAVALGEAMGSSTSELLVAQLAGYEVAVRLGIAFGPSHGRTGWHATGTVGAFAATAACCRLLGLSPDQVVAALGIAVSQAAGINAGIGTSAKPLHAGKAAAAGVLTARLVAAGATGPADGLERYAAIAGATFDPERATDALAERQASGRSFSSATHAAAYSSPKPTALSGCAYSRTECAVEDTP